MCSNLKRSVTYNNHKYIQVAIYKPHGNPKPQIYNRYTHTQKRKRSKHNTKDSHQITWEERKRRNKQKNYKNNQKTINKMVVSTYLSIITVNVNGLNALLKRRRVTEWIHKQDPYICYLQETHFRYKDTHRLKVREWKTVLHVKKNEKKARVAILISEKIDFKTKTITRDKDGYY